MANNYSRFFALLKQINKQGAAVDRKQVVLQFTAGAKDSVTALTTDEYNALCSQLEKMAPKKDDAKLDKTRKAIISQFRSIGKTAVDAKNWAEKYGVGGKKKRFNDYDGQELFVLLQNAKKMKADNVKSVHKRFIDHPDYFTNGD